MTNMTDVEIIDACLNGNQEAFTELVNRYKNLVYSIILRKTNNNDEIDDLAQDVFLKIYKNLASYSSEFKFSTWVMRITSNHIIDFHRKRRAETVPLEAAAEVVSEDRGSSPEDSLLQQEETSRIGRILEELPAMYKIPIVMYHQKDMSYQEIADKLDEPLSKVKNRIFRGRKILKALYAEEGR